MGLARAMELMQRSTLNTQRSTLNEMPKTTGIRPQFAISLLRR
jgi:hypothetical protein